MTRILDSYELSALQAGILFHALREDDRTTYVEQIVATLREPLDEARLLRAWQRVVERHAVLRTRFPWEGVLQEVIDGARMPVEHFDWRDLAEDERRSRLERLADEHRGRGFDLTQAPLMRLALVRSAEAEHTMVWTLHHILLDGHGLFLLLQELFALYESREAELAPPRPYCDYIEWLRSLDLERAKTYWQRALAGFRAPTPLVVASGLTGTGHAIHEYRLSAALTRALRKRARRTHHAQRAAARRMGLAAAPLQRRAGRRFRRDARLPGIRARGRGWDHGAAHQHLAFARARRSRGRDPRMGILYRTYLDGWKASGARLFVHYLNCMGYSKWGRWGALEYLEQPRVASPKFNALQTFIEQNPVWW